MMSLQDSSVRLFSDVFFIYIQQGDKHYTDRMEAHQLRYVLHGDRTCRMHEKCSSNVDQSKRK